MSDIEYAYNDKDRDELMLAVGEGITAFASVEIGLNHLFASMMQPADRRRSAAVLNAARHIETKLRIIQAVGNAFPWEAQQKVRFRNLMNRISRKADVRHKLAHWMLVYCGSVSAKKTEAHYRLLPSSFMDAPQIMKHGLQVAEVGRFTLQCRALMGELFKLSGDLLDYDSLPIQGGKKQLGKVKKRKVRS